MTAGELCIRRVVTAEADETVTAAARRMADENVGDLVVVELDAVGARPIGIVTDRDLVVGVLAHGTPDALQRRVREVMTAPITALDDEPAERVLATLRAHGVRRLPIIDHEGRLQGILTLDDLVAWIREQLDDAAAVVEHQVGPGA